MEDVWEEINLGSLHHHRQLNIGLNHQPPPSSSCSIVTAPTTVLGGVAFQFLDTTDTLVASNPHSFEDSVNFGCFGKKRGQDRGDRRHKRMMKNRESAARSRARKQAYKNELELEISHLQTENAKLKKQQEEFKLSEATQHQVKRTLQRSSTAPF